MTYYELVEPCKMRLAVFEKCDKVQRATEILSGLTLRGESSRESVTELLF